MDEVVGKGKGDSSINSADLYFSFFSPPLIFFDSSLGLLDATFDGAPLLR